MKAHAVSVYREEGHKCDRSQVYRAASACIVHRCAYSTARQPMQGSLQPSMRKQTTIVSIKIARLAIDLIPK